MKNRVLIISVPRQDVSRPPGALAILAACCEQTDSCYEIFDLNLHMHKILDNDVVLNLNSDFSLNKFSKDSEKNYEIVCQEAIAQIDKHKPNIVAISVFTIQSMLATKFLLEQIQKKSNRSKFKLIIGGLGITDTWKDDNCSDLFCEYCLKNNLIDYYITGDGENSFVEFLKGNLDAACVNQLQNVPVLDLDSLPAPSYKKINPADYFFVDKPEIIITGSKGCVRDCTFCNVGSYWKKYVYRNGAHVANDMYQIYKDTGVTKFEFSDSLINGSLKSFRQLNRQLIELKQLDPTFSPRYKGQFICRPIGQMKEQDYIDMKNAGAETLVVGIEHFSEPIRTHMRKHFDNSSIDWHFAQCAKLGIKNVLLLLSGYVTETIDDHQVNIDYLRRYQKYALSRIIYTINIVSTGLFIKSNTPLFEMAHDIGLIVDDNNAGTWVNLNNVSLTPKERIRRASEIIYTAASLNYNVIQFNQKLADVERMIYTLENSSNNYKKIPIVLKQ
jgi:radical SAM superfamily enzyme YgiQ (UPF0313 family)